LHRLRVLGIGTAISSLRLTVETKYALFQNHGREHLAPHAPHSAQNRSRFSHSDIYHLRHRVCKNDRKIQPAGARSTCCDARTPAVTRGVVDAENIKRGQPRGAWTEPTPRPACREGQRLTPSATIPASRIICAVLARLHAPRDTVSRGVRSLGSGYYPKSRYDAAFVAPGHRPWLSGISSDDGIVFPDART
jgi:hypothetical protein